MSIKNKIRAAVQADKAIEECPLCSDRKAEIVRHHPEVKNPASALVTIIKCPTCRPILLAIRNCAKEGHVEP